MGRFRLHTKRLTRHNQLGAADEIKEINAGTINVATVNGTSIIGSTAVSGATLKGSTLRGGTLIGTTSVSGATHAGATFRANTKLVVPTSAYTGSNVTEGACYATGGYLYIGQGGSWKSGSVG